VRVLPDDKVHRRDERVHVQVSGIAQRSLVMFNIAGDGTVQDLYPRGSDKRIIDTPDFKIEMKVSEPFGADQVFAISSSTLGFFGSRSNASCKRASAFVVSPRSRNSVASVRSRSTRDGMGDGATPACETARPMEVGVTDVAERLPMVAATDCTDVPPARIRLI